MSNLKCPFCQQELHSASINGGWLECWNCSYNEPSGHKLPQIILMGTKELWQALIDKKEECDKFEQHYNCLSHVFKHQIEVNDFLNDEANKLQKKLDIAVDALRHVDWFFDGDYVDAKTMHNEIKFAIKAITALTKGGSNE